MKKCNKWIAFVPVLSLAVITASCTLSQAFAVPEILTGNPAGYLRHEVLPDSLAILPPPPAQGSAALKYDEAIRRKSLALQGTPRWKLAAEDASLTFPEAAGTFSCALNAPITEQDTPHLYRLLRKTLADAGASARKAKKHYSRTRPFVVNKEPTCTPDDEKYLKFSGSYPSGHATVGWAWALILSEIDPGHIDAILARGLAFGESRVVCNVHWQNDVIAGRIMGAGVVARLHADPAFRADLKAAGAELAAVRAKGLKSQRDCSFEAAALAK